MCLGKKKINVALGKTVKQSKYCMENYCKYCKWEKVGFLDRFFVLK